MKKLIVIMCTMHLLLSCSKAIYTNSPIGVYSGITPASIEWIPKGTVTLTLRSDNTFYLKWRHLDNSEIQGINYVGKWQKKGQNYIWLKFDEVDLDVQLGPHAISYKDRDIKFIHKNKIKMDDIVLKRIK